MNNLVFCLWSIRRVKTVILKLDMIRRRYHVALTPLFIPVLTKRVLEQRLSDPQPCTQLSELLLLPQCYCLYCFTV